MSNGLATRIPTEAYQPPRQFTFDEMANMADVVARSGLYKMTGAQVMTLMMLCEARGLHPTEALMRYHIFDGKVTMRSDAMQAEFQKSGGRIEWVKDTATECEAIFYHDVHCPKGQLVSFTMDDAEKARLTGKDNWKNHPRPMMRARVITNGVRMVAPGVVVGIYTEDEVSDVPTPVETTARTSLVDTLKSRREQGNTTTLEGWKTPKESHAPVAATVEELRGHGAVPTVPQNTARNPVAPVVVDRAEPTHATPREPTTEVGKMIADALQGANEAIAELAKENPAEKKRLKPININHVVRGVLKEYVERDVIESDALQTGGKEDRQKVADTMTWLYVDDQEDLEATVAKWIGGELTKILDSLKPAAEPAQAELPIG